MSVKVKTCFVCQECGSIHQKWNGKCNDCNAWNSLQEEVMSKEEIKSNLALEDKDFEKLDGEINHKARVSSSILELDRVLGGGMVRGSAILIGGDPGIGKSTLLLQLASNLAQQSQEIVYITGEESTEQVRLRARRLSLEKSQIKLLSSTNVNEIIALINQKIRINQKPDLIIIDSIQTMFCDFLSSAPGTVSQVKASSHELISFAKSNDISLILVGHVTKEGELAGPKVLEHMVDTVLYFEGDRGQHFRIIRAVKNRFGGINEIGVFEMVESGLAEVNNPSKLFLSPIERNISGSAVFAGCQGTRPVLVEMQALVAKSFLPTPRRSVVGWDLNRLATLLAVMNVRIGTNLYDKEVYLNVVGGLKINEPAADLAAAISILSAISNKPIKSKTIVFGEVGLSGEIRMVNHFETRIKEAIKLGFENAIVPIGSKFTTDQILIDEVGHLRQVKELFQ